jgi:hypothetical protein
LRDRGLRRRRACDDKKRYQSKAGKPERDSTHDHPPSSLHSLVPLLRITEYLN